MRKPTANLSAYVSLHDGCCRHYRRSPKGPNCPPFVRSFLTRNLEDVHVQYGAVHREAEQYFARKAAGHNLTDSDLEMIRMELLFTQPFPQDRPFNGQLTTAEEFKARIRITARPKGKSLGGRS
jgi:hypothetical protein